MTEFNEYQSSLEDLNLQSYPQEVQDEFLEYLNSVPFIQRLVSPKRLRCADLPKDSSGRAIIDLTNPPILENIDFFRPTALHYQKHGTLTDLRPNKNPNSQYGMWVKEEVTRIWNGYTRKSDGAWIPGDLYWYLNYTPIIQSKIRRGTKVADRIVDFPEFWEGVWWRMLGWLYSREQGLNFAEIAKRGAGKSFCVASKLAKNFIVGENSINQKNVRSIVTAYQKEYLTKDGTLNKFVDMKDFVSENTLFPRNMLKHSIQEMDWIMGYDDLDSGIRGGTHNEVLGVSAKDDPDKLRGKRASLIVVEEFGVFPKITDTYNVMLPSVSEGDITFGQIIEIGTGGSEGSDFAGAQEMLYHPSGYRLYSLENVYDKSSQGRGQSIFFFPAYINRKGCYNRDGISDVTKALLQICMDRYTVKYNTEDPMQVTRTKAENPITLQDAIMRRDSTLFPVATIMDRLGELDNDPASYSDVYVGIMGQDKNGNPIFKPTADQPIRTFPHKNNKLSGAVEIYEMPKKNKEGKVFSGRYIAGLDPYDDDASETLSLGSLFILDLWTDQIVCEYTGRPMFANDYFEQVRLLLLFYNARVNYENNKKGIFSYFSQMNCLYLLTDTLDFLKDKDLVATMLYGNKAKGTQATQPVNNYARSLIRDWLLKPVQVQKTVDNVQQETTVPNIMTMRPHAMLQELAQWNPDGNFDRVSALGMLMLLREDKMIVFGGNPAKASTRDDSKYLGKDPFFERNYSKSLKNNKRFTDMLSS